MNNKQEIIALIKQIIDRYSVSEAYLFGSILDDNSNSNDIDIGIGMLNKSDFFRLYSDLVDTLELPVDMIPIDSNSKFNQLIRRDGLKIYG